MKQKKKAGIYPGLRFIPAIGLCLAIILWITAAAATSPTGSAEPAESIHLPAVETSAQTPTGTKTTWSCVAFGSYPFAEVVDSTWAAVDDYAIEEGDVIRDDNLFTRLETAEWQDNRTEMDGVSYVRIGLDRAPSTGSREQHYRWDYDRPWHYFRIEPIRWRVLDVQDGKALLLADRMPDCVPFHNTDEDVSWDECTLRGWLNGYGPEANRQGTDYTGGGFIDRAFTDREREAILPTRCSNPENRDYGTSSGENTEDRIFILSNAEVFEGENAGRYGFDVSRDYDDPAKRFTSTLYAKCMGSWWSPVASYAGNSFWFMRTSGYTSRIVTYICDFGFIYSRGTLATCNDAGVLPAMWIDLEKADIIYAGETDSVRIMHMSGTEEASSTAPDIGNPVIIPDETMPGGMATTWNAVTFGHYPQTEITEESDPDLFHTLQETMEEDGTAATVDGTRYVRLDSRWFRCDPIVWRVLEVSDGTALLLADRCLDCVPYHDEYTDVFWEKSALRGWLNGTGTGASGGQSFPETAFTAEELRSVIVSKVSNTNNYYFGTACGSGTRDRVFLLSEEEVFCSGKAERYGFRPDDGIADIGRQVKTTDYAAARGAWRSGNEGTEGNGFWLLRTNGYTRDNVVYVGEKGYLYNRGIPVTCGDAGIVPAIRVRLGADGLERTADISTRK